MQSMLTSMKEGRSRIRTSRTHPHAANQRAACAKPQPSQQSRFRSRRFRQSHLGTVVSARGKSGKVAQLEDAIQLAVSAGMGAGSPLLRPGSTLAPQHPGPDAMQRQGCST